MNRRRNEGVKMDNSALLSYEKSFNDKIDACRDHPRYTWLRKYANDAISFHTGFGYYQIKAADFMDKIIAMSVREIIDWLDGKTENKGV
jgi:hypothetical protein